MRRASLMAREVKLLPEPVAAALISMGELGRLCRAPALSIENSQRLPEDALTA